MKGWLCHGFHADVHCAISMLRHHSDLPVPEPGPGEVLIRVHFAAADPADTDLISGTFGDFVQVGDFPIIPGFDVAGEVCTAGPACQRLRAGDRVVACLAVQEASGRTASSGTFAEYCVCPEVQACKVGADAELSALAGLPWSGLTAYQALFTGGGASIFGERLGTVGAESKVLILGGNRGAGHLAVQMAAQKGAVVTTTVPPGCVHWMAFLGASRVINFREKDWFEYVKGEGFDLVLDCVGWAASEPELERAAEAMKPGGQFITVSCVKALKAFRALGSGCQRHGRHFKALVPKVSAQDLEALTALVASGSLHVSVDQVCAAADLRHALKECISGQCRGKVVLYENCAGRMEHPGPYRVASRHVEAPAGALKQMNAWECQGLGAAGRAAAPRPRCVPVPGNAWDCEPGSEGLAAHAIRSGVSMQPRPVPIPKQGEVLVRMCFAAVDALDVRLLTGEWRGVLPSAPSLFVPGFDGAGQVVALGPGCSRLALGDRVVLFLGVEESCCSEAPSGPAGACAEFCVCPERQVCKVPRDINLSSVAGLPFAGLTAYQALFTGHGSSTCGGHLGSVDQDTRVLVLGGNRAVGHLAVQLAHAAGAHVTATVPPSCVDWMFRLGAGRAVNFREELFLLQLEGERFDLILDCIGWAKILDEVDRVTAMMKPGAQYISTAPLPFAKELGAMGEWKGRSFKSMLPKARWEDLDLLVQRVEAGTLEVAIDQICPFNELRHALRECISGQCRGKVLLCHNGTPQRSSFGAPQAALRPAEVPPALKHSVMTAWQCEEFGTCITTAVQGLRVADKVPLPALEEEDQALVRVHFAAVDPMDVKLITGGLGGGFPVRKFPFVPGFDAAGEVVAVGSACTRVQVGDRVALCLGVRESLGCCGEFPPTFGPAGAFAEYCACPDAQLSRLPPEVLLTEVAGLPLAGLTAYQALFTGGGASTLGERLGSTRRDDKVLILGGNRGAGHLAVQMAVRKGAHVTATVPPSFVNWMISLGVDRAIDFHEVDWARELQGEDFDLVFDCVGWATSAEEMDLAAGVLRQGGLYVSNSNFDAFNELGMENDRYGRIFKAVIPIVNSEDLDLLVSWVDNYTVHVEVDEICRFSALRHALRESVAGQCRGKVLVCQRDSSIVAGFGKVDAAPGGA